MLNGPKTKPLWKKALAPSSITLPKPPFGRTAVVAVVVDVVTAVVVAAVVTVGFGRVAPVVLAGIAPVRDGVVVLDGIIRDGVVAPYGLCRYLCRFPALATTLAFATPVTCRA